MQKAIVFIDGNNFYHCIKKTGIRPSSIDFLKLSELACLEFGLAREKTIYYNSIPSIATGKESYYKHIAFINELKKLPKFEVKTRKLQRKSNKEIIEEKKVILESLKLCKNCSPKAVQNCVECLGSISEKEKGIDVMLAIDMVEKALKNELETAVLISGDADFIPALNLVKANGKQAKIAFLQKGFSNALKQAFPKDFTQLDAETIQEKCVKNKN